MPCSSGERSAAGGADDPEAANLRCLPVRRDNATANVASRLMEEKLVSVELWTQVLEGKPWSWDERCRERGRSFGGGKASHQLPDGRRQPVDAAEVRLGMGVLLERVRQPLDAERSADGQRYRVVAEPRDSRRTSGI